ncbi:MAG: hypothetical protein ACRCXS_05025, partial [Cetobacterium sp.]
MKKIILLYLMLVSCNIFSKDNINITIPSNTTDMYLYKDLEKGEYQGVYIDIFADVLKNKNISINLDGEDSDVVLRTIETLDGKRVYDYFDTPMIYRVGVVVNKNSTLSNLGNIKNLKVAYIPNQHGLKEFKERYNNLKLEKIEVKNLDEGLEKLSEEEVDAFIVQDWYDKNSGETNYKLLENIRYNEQIAIRKNLKNLHKEIEETMGNVKGDSFQKL